MRTVADDHIHSLAEPFRDFIEPADFLRVDANAALHRAGMNFVVSLA